MLCPNHLLVKHCHEAIKLMGIISCQTFLKHVLLRFQACRLARVLTRNQYSFVKFALIFVNQKLYLYDLFKS